MYIDRFNNSVNTAPFLIELQLFAEGEGVVNTFDAAMKLFTEDSGEGQAVEGTEQGGQLPHGGQTPHEGASSEQLQDPVKDNLAQSGIGSPDNKDNLPMFQQLGFKSENDIAVAYQNLRSDYTRKAQELAQLRNGLNNQQAANSEADLEKRIIERLQSQGLLQPPQQPQVQQPKQLTAEELEAEREEFEEAFYKDMPGTIEKLVADRLERLLAEKLKPVEERINPVIEELQQEKEAKSMQELVGSFAQLNPDMMDYIEDMKMFFQENAELPRNENSLRVAYNYAKGLKASINPQQLLSDPNYVISNIANNPELLKQLIQNR